MPYDVSRIRWLLFVAWLDSGLAGMLPTLLCLTPGLVRRLLSLARQVAAAVGPWLFALLTEYQQRQARGAKVSKRSPAITLREEDLRQQPFAAGELRQEPSWLQQMAEAELARLFRLTAAARLTSRPGWLEWETRYWALAVSLVRLGQLYAALEHEQGSLPAGHLLEEGAARIWNQTLDIAPA